MKAPTPLGLRALRSLAFPPSTTSRRCYAAVPERAQIQPPPPPRTFKTPPPPPEPQWADSTTSSTTPTPPPPPPQAQKPPPAPNFRPTPSGPSLRKKRDNDEDFTPYPLTRPIGIPHPPDPMENMGLDKRSLSQRRDDFHDYNKHLERRASMTKQIAKPYFRDWSNMRFHKGKVFVAPERLFRADVALWFPNFFGRTLLKKSAVEKRMGVTDGYGGLGRGTTEILRNKISVVSLVGNDWAQRQVDSFCGKTQNSELHALLAEHKGLAQRVEVNWETNWLKWWILRLFAVRNLRKSRAVDEQGRYFLVRRGFSEIMKEAIGVLNDKGGIRWAGSAEAEEGEKKSLAEGVRRLVKESRLPPKPRLNPVEQKEKLEAAVLDVMDEPSVPQKTPMGASQQ
ncbi:Mitochondrial ATPase complex subunit atp10 [Elasticomyces elasticus]|uniref:Mitochondrial ATPase complex subunit atp10 n=1 Tax=Elasticomyces elasticus TaxID=574655 RepID=A0AAN7ZLV7_9PEZI|nr:Mitochondrial ATPase complex subunit atp10 [Elasticomyces elasticus]